MGNFPSCFRIGPARTGRAPDHRKTGRRVMASRKAAELSNWEET